jgi:hypothetical protein
MRVAVNRLMNELPANAPTVALAFVVTADAVSDPVERAELPDVEMDHLVGACRVRSGAPGLASRPCHPSSGQLPAAELACRIITSL